MVALSADSQRTIKKEKTPFRGRKVRILQAGAPIHSLQNLDFQFFDSG